MLPSVAERPTSERQYPSDRATREPGAVMENALIEARLIADQTAADLFELIAETERDLEGAMRVVKTRMEKRLEEIRERARARATELPALARVA